ncbi:hypothetical protein [Romboutsia sp.]|uniref:hypothetical protein n=1 Tax=Romboutsia sp. TaxID=1965302 RepID=UPI002C1AFEB3|nr:hypothetical protein [Romboutsia sp.]HSQ89501.1 hypothetical protein [Romboutsia sp.]
MKDKTIRIITFIFGVTTILLSLLSLAFSITMPGVVPISFSIAMLGLIYSTKQKFNKGKVSKTEWKFTFYGGLIVVFGNFYEGICQIILAIK